jgi:hypothetical protein
MYTFVPTTEELMLVRDALSAFNHANITNNYSVMHAMGSSSFRGRYFGERLSQLFAVYRVNKVNLAPVLYLSPALTRPAVIENGRLRLEGSFPSKPMKTKFDLTFEISEGLWKLCGISVTLELNQKHLNNSVL